MQIYHWNCGAIFGMAFLLGAFADLRQNISYGFQKCSDILDWKV